MSPRLAPFTKKTHTVQFTKDEGGKTYWPVVGAAFTNEDGAIRVKLDSLPFNWDGRLFLFPVEEK